MNKYLKFFSGAAIGLILSGSAFAAADYAVVLKTLSNPFWVDMKKGIEDEAKNPVSALIFLPRLQKAISSRSYSSLKISAIKITKASPLRRSPPLTW